jgi:hypothetical protein
LKDSLFVFNSPATKAQRELCRILELSELIESLGTKLVVGTSDVVKPGIAPTLAGS